MASSYKTSHLGLNNWTGSDKPKRVDFVNDNEILDTALGEHLEDQTVHVTADERTRWNSFHPEIGSYTGTGEVNRTITLGYHPVFVMVFPVGDVAGYYRGSTINSNDIYSGFAAREGGTKGIEIKEDGFLVRSVPTIPPDTKTFLLNEEGKSYIYLALAE